MSQTLLKRKYTSIKTLSLNDLTAKQHLLMALCRDVSLLPPLYYIFLSLQKASNIMISPNIKLYEPQYLKDILSNFWQTYMVNNNITIIFSSASTSAPSPEPTSKLTNSIESDTGFLILNSLITARASEHLFCALWCLVSLYLSYSILDSLMVRWIVKYSTVAAIVRMFSMSLIFVTFELLLLNSLSPENNYFLHTWILISCILTGAYIWQSYLTSDLNYIRANGKTKGRRTISSPASVVSSSDDNDEGVDVSLQQNQEPEDVSKLRKKQLSFNFTTKRTIDLYNIIVFCVVPVGLASFITMVGLLRNLFIQRLDVEQLARILQETMH